MQRAPLCVLLCGALRYLYAVYKSPMFVSSIDFDSSPAAKCLLAKKIPEKA